MAEYQLPIRGGIHKSIPTQNGGTQVDTITLPNEGPNVRRVRISVRDGAGTAWVRCDGEEAEAAADGTYRVTTDSPLIEMVRRDEFISICSTATGVGVMYSVELVPTR